ncbi:MAG: hypothetical protein ACRCZP_13600 [Phycicoccus sp.]
MHSPSAGMGVAARMVPLGFRGVVVMAGAHDDALASAVLGAAVRVDEHRGAVSRCALLWWEGRAAERYRREVGARSAALGVLSEELQAAAALVETGAVREVRASAGATPRWRP